MRGEYAVGIDVGGTKIEGVLMDEAGVVHKRKRIPTLAQEGPAIVLERIAMMVRKLTSRKHLKIGVSFPGHIDHEGLLRECPNIPELEGQPLRQLLQRHIKHPLVVENDAKCFALAEQCAGAAAGHPDVVGVVVGTGIGAGVICGGCLVRGAQGGAGELGHRPYGESDLEAYASGPGILRRYFAHGGVKEKAERIFERKTLIGKKTVRETVEALAWLCVVIEKAYDPSIIVLGGGVSNAPIIRSLGEEAKARGVRCKVARNSLGDAAGALGAAYLALGLR